MCEWLATIALPPWFLPIFVICNVGNQQTQTESNIANIAIKKIGRGGWVLQLKLLALSSLNKC